jgi:hypothetical protein
VVLNRLGCWLGFRLNLTILDVLTVENLKINGTNCFNCMSISKSPEGVDLNSLNDQGGLNPQSQDEMKRAQKADLITLPGGTRSDIISKKFCNHPAIQMYVTIRMCCAYWDSPGVIRPWKTGEILPPMTQ